MLIRSQRSHLNAPYPWDRYGAGVLLLGIDTATASVAAALHDGDQVVRVLTEPANRAHGERLPPLVERLLAESGMVLGQLTHVGVGVGPGPYTGLRVGVVWAAVLAKALGIVCVGVGTHDALAEELLARGREATERWAPNPLQPVPRPGASSLGPPEDFGVVTDARRREVFWARYRADGVRLLGPQVGTPAEVGAGPLAELGLLGELDVCAATTAASAGFLLSAPAMAGAGVAMLAARLLRAGPAPGPTAEPAPGPTAEPAPGPTAEPAAGLDERHGTPVGLLPVRPLYLRRPDARESVRSALGFTTSGPLVDREAAQ